MPTFFVTLKNDESKELEAFSRADLVEQHFGGDEAKLKAEAKLIRWHHNTIQFSENLETGKTDQEVSTADANPYGWREQGDKNDTDSKSA